MNLDYKDIEKIISEKIIDKKSQLNKILETIEEAKEYGWNVTFGTEDIEKTIKNAFEYGVKIGEIYGEIDQLNACLNFLYTKEFEKEE